MRQVPSREELQGILRALLLTRKEAITTGISLAQLDSDYRMNEGTRIPYRELGYSALLDCLQTLTGGLIVRYRHGMHYAFPVVDEKIKHVSEMVAGQKDSKKNFRSGRSQYRSPSPWYPRVSQPPVRVDCRILAEIITLVKESPGGISFHQILNYVRQRMNYNISASDLSHQLAEISHEVNLYREVLYPARRHQRVSQSHFESATVVPTRATDKYQSRPRAGGASSSDSDQDDDFATSLANTVRNNKPKNDEPNDEPKTQEMNLSRCETGRTKNEIHEESTDENRCADVVIKNTGAIKDSTGRDCNDNFANTETIADLITEKTRIRLEMLIRKYPEGIWCAELPRLYKEEYKIPLNYEEVGFGSVSDFASHLPEIFHCIQLQEKGDFKLFSAKAGKPDVRQTKRPVLTTAALHNIYEKYEIEAIPAVLSKETAARLIPDGVMVPGETVAQICVTELDRGISEYIDVVVVDVFTPSFFWIHLLKKIPNFRRFMDDLHAFYERSSSKYLLPIAVMERGLNCACIYDGKWHRAIIKTVRPDNLVTLLFYDYGTVATYAPDDIHFLHRTFSSLPAQAIPCGLWNVKPVEGPKWTRIITTEFAQKVSNIPLVATIAHIDTDNNSMMVGLTNTEGVEDFHINDWMVDKKYATFGKMEATNQRSVIDVRLEDCKVPYLHPCNFPDRDNNVDTVDMTDQPVETFYNEAFTRQPPGLFLGTIPEEIDSLMTNSSLANGIGTSEELTAILNAQVLMSAKLTKIEINKCVNFGISYDTYKPAVQKELEELFHCLLNIGLSVQPIIVASPKLQEPPIPPLPKPTSQSNENIAEGTTATCINSNACPEISTSESTCPSFEIHPSITSKDDLNMNISTKSPIIDQSTSATNDLPHVKTTNCLLNEIMESHYDNSSLVSSDSRTEDPTRLVETPRAIFERSLAHSAKNFFERVTVSSTRKTSVDTLTGELPDTNPFKNDIDGVKDLSCSMPPLPPRNPLRRPHDAPNSHKKNPPVESQMRLIYEAAPIMYDNGKMNGHGSRLDSEISTIFMESDDLSEAKRDNIESWIQKGHLTSGNYATERYGNSAPPLPPRNFPSSVANGIREENLCNGSNLFGDNSVSTGCLTSSEWSEKVESPMNFRREDTSLQSFDDCRLESDGEISDGKNIVMTDSHDKDAIKRDNSSEFWDFYAVQLSKDLVYLIKYDNEGWIVVEEFAELIGKAPDVIMRILEIRKFPVPFQVISRSDNSRLFEKLDRTSVRVPRDHNKKIGDSLNLVPLRRALKILEKLRIATSAEIKRINENIFPADSSVLLDVYTLIKACRNIQK